ncbi:energy-coupling factor transporter transmembrane component T family protein [Agilicoccus flavus]|uniref:energy-coupling factor transporter transmembrane component T family protein n=1 Tax=Agilicoccus flavus TaxID=2775968 RepID=UPI001CF70A15|nr:energy-coupling factor transporter transmembrane component T [Agilicoccus flavus]
MLTSLYVPGHSWLHRAPVGGKVLGLLVATTLLLAWRDPAAPALGAVVVAAVHLGAGLGVRRLLAQVWALRWVVAVLAVLQWWAAGPREAVVVVGGLLVAILAAGVVTATTRIEAMMDAVVGALGPLRRVGVDPDRVALALGLTIRTVPALTGIAREVADARAARGMGRSPRALLVPLVVRAVRHADAVGDALVARGVDDGPGE